PWHVSPPPAFRYATHSLYVLCMGRDVARAAPSSKAGVANSWQSLQAVALRSSSRDPSAARRDGPGPRRRGARLVAAKAADPLGGALRPVDAGVAIDAEAARLDLE